MATNSQFAQSQLLWKPADPSKTRVDVFRRMINRKWNKDLKDYYDLHKYSVEDYTFWADLWEFLGIVSSVPPSKVLVEDSSNTFKTWFPGVLMNYAENLLKRRDDAIAVVATGELGHVERCSYRQLHEHVRRMAAALKANGLKRGDRVAAIVTNSITALTIALATLSIGAIYSSTATDMGTSGILDRYRQIEPTFVFAETEVQYNGAKVDLLPKVRDVMAGLKSEKLRAAVLLPSAVDGKVLGGEVVPQSVLLSRFLLTGGGDRPLEFEQVPFDHPAFILYSSGTSGPPKCIVHSHGGTLLQTKKDLVMGMDAGEDDTYFQFTTTGWMMWTFMIIGLSIGSRIVLYDGSPFYPDVRKYLKMISDEGVSLLGTSPRFLSEVQGRGINPLDIGPFSSIRTIGVTGAVLTPPLFEWAQKAFSRRNNVYLVSTSGGTDVCCAFVGGVPTFPVYTGEIQGKALGMKVHVYSPPPSRQDLELSSPGEAGELVCTRPHPSVPRFWGDDGERRSKVLETYFGEYGVEEGVWRQGDFMVVNPRTGGIMLLGRSDGVLNPSGVRFGSGEIYAILEQGFADVIDDSICVGQLRPGVDTHERVLLFVKMRRRGLLSGDPEMVGRIKDAVRRGLSARHVPWGVWEVDDIPYTVNGKKIEILVKQIVSGKRDVKVSGTVANPESLEGYGKFRDLESGQGGRVKGKL